MEKVNLTDEDKFIRQLELTKTRVIGRYNQLAEALKNSVNVGERYDLKVQMEAVRDLYNVMFSTDDAAGTANGGK